MLHELLNLARPLFVIDCETTGTNIEQDRIVEIGFQKFMREGMVQEWRSYVNPGIPIPKSASAIHSITTQLVNSCRTCERSRADHLDEPLSCESFRPWPYFGQLAPSFVKGFTNCDYAGMNVRFDLQILAAEMRRAKVPWNYNDARIIDARRLETIVEPRSLSALHKKYVSREHDGAHGALSDVRAAATVLFFQLQQHPLPRDIEQLHALQWPDWIDMEGKFRFVEGVPCFTNWSKHANRPMKEVDVGFWDFVLKSDFSPEIKQIAAEAKLGRFPTCITATETLKSD